MSIEYQNSILWRGGDPSKQKFQPKVDASKKTIRYFPGQAPSWSEKGKEEEKNALGFDKTEKDLRQAKRRRERDKTAAAVVVEDAASSRLKRLQAAASAGESGSERLLRHRLVHEATVLEASNDKAEESDEEKMAKKEESMIKSEDLGVAELNYDEVSGSDEDDMELRDLRRARARELALQKRKVEEDVLKDELEQEEEDELAAEESSEYETDSEDNDPRGRIMMKPVFVSKVNRETVREKELQEQEELEQAKKKEEKLKERKVETKGMVIDELQKEVDAAHAKEDENDKSDIELIDDDDEINEAEEYELWKIRELKRIKRDKEERNARAEEIEFVLRRRAMTDEEREKDDKRLDAINPKAEKAKAFSFLQKYYHKGGFFQDKATDGSESLYLRDYHEPLEEEKFDKQLLPKAMQLRRGEFGKKGQVKHSHLTEVDTTDMSAAWAQSTKQIQRYQEKMAGASGVNRFDRPGVRKT
eukprot:TRINITY_DN20342_c0_g2_i2.p1 TRINITY_DN20342_c0_g2~~TRINITY_DN20342_c0_g2_i2.p1  ORF type:complete len:475 (-),score=175.09 TRINITY_DN20342_c0_g2_i2:321-1745(-)